MSLAEALLSAALVLVPAERHADRPWGSETPEQVEARYAELAADIASVVLDPDESPVRGMTRAQSAGLLLGLATGESGLAYDTDVGPCYREGSWVTRCDRGRSASVFQLLVEDGREWRGTTITATDIFADRRLAARVALSAVRASVGKCWHLPPEYRLSAYGAGVCVRLEGAAERWRLGQRAIALVEGALQEQRKASE